MPAPDPLEMAENCVAGVVRMARLVEEDELGAYVARAGDRGVESARMAGNLALVSIARDLRRVVDRLERDDP